MKHAWFFFPHRKYLSFSYTTLSNEVISKYPVCTAFQKGIRAELEPVSCLSRVHLFPLSDYVFVFRRRSSKR